MTMIALSEGFSLIPEGTHIFRINEVKFDPNFGKMQIMMENQDGLKHIERFSLLKQDGSPNEGALNAFSYFAKIALNDFSRTEVDHEELVGCFMECDVEHEVIPSKNNSNKDVTFARLGDKRASDGWPEETAQPPTPAPDKKKSKIDLKSLLG